MALTDTTLSGPPSSSPTSNDIQAFDQREREIEDELRNSLYGPCKLDPPIDGDELFSSLAGYTKVCIDQHIPSRAIWFWKEKIEPLITKFECESSSKIHKGGPIYNCGVAYADCGAMDQALVYIEQAGIEDENLGRPSAARIVHGDHELSKQVLIDPLVKKLSQWAKDYKAITGHELDEREVTSLVAWLAGLTKKALDAIQFLVAMHRLITLENGIQNRATEHLRVQALSDLVLVVESSLKHWQSGHFSGLDHRVRDHNGGLTMNTASASAYSAMNKSYTAIINTQKQGWKLTVDGHNRAIHEARQQLRGANQADSAGICLWVIAKIRNSVHHSNEETLSLRVNPQEFTEAVAWTLAAIRLSMHWCTK